MGGGFFFGLWWGFLIVLAGNVIATATSFALSRFVARRWFREKLSRNLMLRSLGPAVERESWKIILLSQLHPLFPTSLLNYFYGLTRIRFATLYVLGVDRKNSRTFLLRIHRHPRTIRCANYARRKLPPNC